MRFGCLFFLLPFVEFALLYQVGTLIGGWNVVGIVLVTAFLGVHLVRRERRRMVAAIRSEVAKGSVPSRAVMDGVAIIAGGVLLAIPGFISDAFGLLLLFPLTRRHFYRAIQGSLMAASARGGVRVMSWGRGFGGPGGGGPGGGGPGGRFGGGFGGPPGGSAGSSERIDGGEDERPPRPGEIIQ